jgi:predicted nucleic-acid-binding Zn-ribbon protein
MKNGTCPKCSSQEIMAEVRVKDRGGRFNPDNPLKAVVDEPEVSLSMSDGASGQVRAWICAQCGYTELYTDNLENLYRTYKRYKAGK